MPSVSLAISTTISMPSTATSRNARKPAQRGWRTM
ncbi:MAG: hypothetical protein IJK42_14965 [Prevotella sp.]|nr:hypothetical protein [Prevotella sp.]